MREGRKKRRGSDKMREKERGRGITAVKLCNFVEAFCLQQHGSSFH